MIDSTDFTSTALKSRGRIRSELRELFHDGKSFAEAIEMVAQNHPLKFAYAAVWGSWRLEAAK